MELKVSTKEFANILNKSTSYVYDNLDKLTGNELLFAKKDSNNKYVLILNPFFKLKQAKITALQESKELRRKIISIYTQTQLTAIDIISQYNKSTVSNVKKECNLFENDKTISNIDATIASCKSCCDVLTEREEFTLSLINKFSADMINDVCISERNDSVYLYINTSTNESKAELFNALASFKYNIINASIFEKDEVRVRISDHLPIQFISGYKFEEIQVKANKNYANDILIFFKDTKKDFKFKFV